MAGTVDVSDESCWMSPGWIHDNVLDLLAANLEENDSSLAKMLLGARTYENAGYLDLRSENSTTLGKLVRASHKAIKTLESQGADSFYDPSAFGPFMDHIRRLEKMLSAAHQSRLAEKEKGDASP